jgi:hypothetical protein
MATDNRNQNDTRNQNDKQNPNDKRNQGEQRNPNDPQNRDAGHGQHSSDPAKKGGTNNPSGNMNR